MRNISSLSDALKILASAAAVRAASVLLIITAIVMASLTYSVCTMTGAVEMKRVITSASRGSGTDFTKWPYIADRLFFSTMEIRLPQGVSSAAFGANGGFVLAAAGGETAPAGLIKNFIDINSGVRRAIIDRCAPDFERLRIEETDIAYDARISDPLSEKFIDGGGVHDKLVAIAALASIAADSGDVEFASAADVFLFRTIRSFAYYSNRYMSVSGAVAQYLSLRAVSGLSKRLYIENDELLKDPSARDKIKKALLIRSRCSTAFSRADRAVRYLMAYILDFMSAYEKQYPLTMALLNMWYGSSIPVELEWWKLIRTMDALNFREIRPSLADLENDFNERIIGGARSFSGSLYMHPLVAAYFRHPIEYSKVFGKLDGDAAAFRLVTLAGLSRVFYAENGRWPDPKKDKKFIKEAADSCDDVAGKTRFSFTAAPDGSLEFYGAGNPNAPAFKVRPPSVK